MLAARIESFGGPEALRIVPIGAPAVGPGQVQVDVAGSSINPLDIAVRSGWMTQFLPLQLPLTLGTDIAGIVAAVGEGVTGFAVGDQVYGVAGVVMGSSGAFAEQAITSADMLAAAPTKIDLAAAATLPLAGIAALEAITERLYVRPGSRVLVHGASGGVGVVAVALVRHLGGHVVATARGNGVATLKELGVDDVVDTSTTEVGSLEPFDLTLDLVGSDPVLPVMVTRPGGRVVGLRTMPDQQAAAAREVDAVLQGTAVTTERLNRLRSHVDQAVVGPYVAQTFDLPDVARAVAAKEAGGVPGKIAVRVG